MQRMAGFRPEKVVVWEKLFASKAAFNCEISSPRSLARLLVVEKNSEYHEPSLKRAKVETRNKQTFWSHTQIYDFMHDTLIQRGHNSYEVREQTSDQVKYQGRGEVEERKGRSHPTSFVEEKQRS